MIIDLHEKYDVSPEWFEGQVKDALAVAAPEVVEKLTLPRLCTLLAVYKVKDEAGAKEAAKRIVTARQNRQNGAPSEQKLYT